MEEKPSACTVCNKMFSSKSNLRKHLKAIHKLSSDEALKSIPATLSKRNTIECVLCKERIFNRFVDIERHFSEHAVKIEKEELNFIGHECFYRWKSDMENETNAQFVKYHTSHHGTKTYFQCNRSGSYKPKGQGVRALKTQGSRKIEGRCPASLILSPGGDDLWSCTFIKTHVGHSNNLEHLNLPAKCRGSIFQRLTHRKKRDMTDSVFSELHRNSLLTNKDIICFEKAFNLNYDVNQCNVKLSLASFVVEDLESSVSCVLFFKNDGEESPEYPLSTNDFILIIMNSSQCEMLKRYGNNIICMDSTHEIKNNYLLTSIFVLDEMRQSFLCAFLISNKIDMTTLTVFLKEVKKAVGIIKAKVFMSDIDQCFYNAWMSVMGPTNLQLYCTWLAFSAWEKNIKKKIKDKKMQHECTTEVKALMNEIEQSAFLKMLDTFVNNLDLGKQDFVNYFVNNYSKEQEKWALCYRSCAIISANMHLERMHCTIKYIYLKGLRNQQLNKAIFLLMKYLKDNMFNTLITLNKGNGSIELGDLHKSHERSKHLRNTIIEGIEENTWRVQASSDHEVCYIVEVATSNCSCVLKCEQCKACIHNYTCECWESSIKWNMCEHVHLVCQYLMRESELCSLLNERDSFMIEVESQTTEIDDLSEDFTEITGHTGSISQLKDAILAKLKILTDIAESTNNIEELEAMDKLLVPIQPTLSALGNQNVIGKAEQYNEPWKGKISKQRGRSKKEDSSICSEEIVSASLKLTKFSNG